MAAHSCFRISPLSVLIAFAFTTFSLPVAFAQDDSSNDSTVVYTADYFAEYAPITAQDMLDRIPGQGQNSGRSGGSSSGGGSGLASNSGGNASSGGRGLGAGNGGNEILVNGKRTAGKSNQTSDLLRRISASQVQEIQIIRGTSGELDVRGSSQVVNIILFEELASNTTSYELSADRFKDASVEPGGSMALSGQAGNLTYQVSAASRTRYEHSVSNEESILGDISPNDFIHEERIRDQRNDELSVNLAYDISANSSLRVNGLYGISDAPVDVERFTTNLRLPGQPITQEVSNCLLAVHRGKNPSGHPHRF